MNQREKNDLDNYITGHYGNDQFDGDEPTWETECIRYYGKVLRGPDAHWCADFDGLPVTAFTRSYICCTEEKTLFGRICNYFYELFWGLIEWLR